MYNIRTYSTGGIFIKRERLLHLRQCPYDQRCGVFNEPPPFFDDLIVNWRKCIPRRESIKVKETILSNVFSLK